MCWGSTYFHTYWETIARRHLPELLPKLVRRDPIPRHNWPPLYIVHFGIPPQFYCPKRLMKQAKMHFVLGQAQYVGTPTKAACPLCFPHLGPFLAEIILKLRNAAKVSLGIPLTSCKKKGKPLAIVTFSSFPKPLHSQLIALRHKATQPSLGQW